MSDRRVARPGRSTWRASVTAASDDSAFARFATEHGAKADRLRADLPALLGFLADHRELLDDERMVDAAAVTLGGAILAAHPYARWVRTPELEIEGPGMNLVITPITRGLIEDRGTHRDLLDTLSGWPRAHADDREIDALELPDELAPPAPLPLVPRGFVMPDLSLPVFTDDDGAVIDYGRRYPDDTPDDAYSRTSHPERFAPLRVVAEAVSTFLAEHYDVSVTAAPDPRGSAVLMRPASGAPVTIVITDFPGVLVSAGAFFEGRYPACGCDACDETVGPVAEQFVDEVLGIVGGGLTEHYPVGARGWTHRRLRTTNGVGGGQGEPDFGPDRAAEVVRLLAGLEDGHWPAWPRAVAASTGV